MTKSIALGILFAVPAWLFAQQPPNLPEEGAAEGSGANADAGQRPIDPPTGRPADPPAASAAAPAFVPLTPGEKTARRAERLVEPLTLLGAAMGGGIEQWRDIPPKWGQGWDAYAARFASAEGYNAAHNGVALMFDLAMHTDPRYHRMAEAGFKARLWNAVSQSFIATKDDGGTTVNLAEIGGNFGAGFIANAWNPPLHDRPMDGLERGAIGFAYHTGKNVLREFMPDLLRMAHLRSAN